MKTIELGKNEYAGYASKQDDSQFLQSWEWGELQREAGKPVLRLGFEEDGKIFFAVSLIMNRLPLGFNYFYAPRIGIGSLNEDQTEFAFKEIAKTAKGHKAVFLRFDPVVKFGLRPPAFDLVRTIDVQPSKTLILELASPEAELLGRMRPKTRYNIGLAEKKGVTVREANEADFGQWWKIMEETRARDGFRSHSKEHYRKMLFGKQDKQGAGGKGQDGAPGKCAELDLRLLLAVYQDGIIAGNIVAGYGDTATYVHGASSDQCRNVMATYLLQWEAIRQAKAAGYRYYDFYGISEEKWPGVTRFKRGFGGQETGYPGTFDLVFDPLKYKFYQGLRILRRKI